MTIDDSSKGGRRGRSTSSQPARIDTIAWLQMPGYIRAFSGIASGDRVLDIPCADGALAFELSPYCGYVTGADSSEDRIAASLAAAVESGCNNVSFQAADLDHLEFGEKVFDRVFSWDGLHHFADPGAAIDVLARMLTSPGYLILADMAASEDRAWREMHNRIEKARDPSHVGVCTPPEVRNYLGESGLVIERELRWIVRRDFDAWMAWMSPDRGTIERTRRLMTDAARKRGIDLEVMVRGKVIEFEQRYAGWVAIKLA